MPQSHNSRRQPSVLRFNLDGVNEVAQGQGAVDDEMWYSNGVILAGDWVAVDRSATGTYQYNSIVQAPASADNPEVIGVAMNAASAAGEEVRVRRQGFITPDDNDAVSVNVATASAAGDLLVMSATAGRAATAGGDTERGIGVAFGEPAANVCTWLEVRCRS